MNVRDSEMLAICCTLHQSVFLDPFSYTLEDSGGDWQAGMKRTAHRTRLMRCAVRARLSTSRAVALRTRMLLDGYLTVQT
jgi:hypothetical protein